MKKKLILIPFLTIMLIVALIVATGCAGDTGLKGSRGPEGSQGIQGEQGEQGEQGDPGLQGEIGPQGEAGIQGVMGRTGQKGAAGSSGATGEQGEQGERGRAGVGARGVIGATGSTGPQGEQGIQGVPGEDYNLQALLDLQAQIDALHRPQMETIYPLSVITHDTLNVSIGTVEIVFDFYDAGDDLRDLMIDWSFAPYTQDRKAQTNFLATEDMGIDPTVLAAMADVGLVPKYYVEEQKWTLTIDTNAIMTEAIFAFSIFDWVEAVGEPIFPAGRYDWYIEVRDWAGNKWGNMMSPPAYSHYVNYFHSGPE